MFLLLVLLACNSVKWDAAVVLYQKISIQNNSQDNSCYITFNHMTLHVILLRGFRKPFQSFFLLFPGSLCSSRYVWLSCSEAGHETRELWLDFFLSECFFINSLLGCLDGDFCQIPDFSFIHKYNKKTHVNDRCWS